MPQTRGPRPHSFFLPGDNRRRFDRTLSGIRGGAAETNSLFRWGYHLLLGRFFPMNKERIGSLFLLGVGIYALALSVGFPMGTLAQIGPGPYPLALSILLCAAGAIIFLSAKGGTERVKIDLIGFIKKHGTPLKIIILTGAYIIALKRAGYLAGSILYLFSLFFWVCRYKLWVALVLSLLFGIGSWYFFVKICDVSLPQGLYG